MSLLLSSAPSALLLAAARGVRLLPGLCAALPAAAAAGRAPACVARPFSGSAAAAAASPWADYPASRPRRVVVTGLGLVTPLGAGVPASWAGLMEGRSAVRALSAADLPEARALRLPPPPAPHASHPLCSAPPPSVDAPSCCGRPPGAHSRPH